MCTAPGLAEGLPLHMLQKILPNSGGWGFDPESPAPFMASHLHPNPGRRSQNVESLRLNPGDSGSHPLANPLPIRVPGSRWETRTLRDPDPGSSPVRVQLATRHGHLQSPGLRLASTSPGRQAGPWALGGASSDCPCRSPNAGSFSPALHLSPLLPHTLSLSFFQILSPIHILLLLPTWSLCMTFTVKNSPTPTHSFSSTHCTHVLCP